MGALPAWLAALPARPRRAALVPTAANPLASAPYVQAAADLLTSEGLVVEYLDLEHAAHDDVRRVLTRSQVVFVVGGYAMFLLQHARRSGFARLAATAIRSGSLAYVGISAGAALAGPDLRSFQDADDPGIVSSTAGLGLVPFVVLAHRDRGRAARHDRQAAELPWPVVSIRDDQAVTVAGTGWSIRSSPG
ncbi:Type 1 glutamine amidotransferase-like domain-containing protein [Spirillospora sp. NPDC048819]|uniref:Type 1 glutamine amidotransferase-like domain-containing protein n=1 Tax=Spirillospora sp. NPDC048819 TaxID=3155268 RepID=UPI0033E60173